MLVILCYKVVTLLLGYTYCWCIVIIIDLTFCVIWNKTHYLFENCKYFCVDQNNQQMAPLTLLTHSCSFREVFDYIFAYLRFSSANDTSNFFLQHRNSGWLVGIDERLHISMANSGRQCVRLHGHGISHATTALSLAHCDRLPHPAETISPLNLYQPKQATKTPLSYSPFTVTALSVSSSKKFGPTTRPVLHLHQTVTHEQHVDSLFPKPGYFVYSHTNSSRIASHC